MNIQLIRHATLLLHIGNLKILVDPMLSDPGVNPPINNSTNNRRNPLVPLPVPINDLLDVDLILVTHTHRDHWDESASQLLPKHIPLLCQPCDTEKFRDAGFTSVHPVRNRLEYHGITFTRTGGRHGTDVIGRLMGRVSGFVLQKEDQPTLYLAGDTIWCSCVQKTLTRYQPDITIVNAGGAQFTHGDPITMTAADVTTLCHHATHTKVIAVHLDSINHCLETRDLFLQRIEKAGLSKQVQTPPDGSFATF